MEGLNLSQLFYYGTVFLDAINGLRKFLFTHVTIPSSLGGAIFGYGPEFSGTVVELLIGGGLVFMLGFRLVKFYTDLVL